MRHFLQTSTWTRHWLCPAALLASGWLASAAPAADTFAPPTRITAGGEPVAVESPGYACPTMADIDGDGKDDLIVGQFRDGNMLFCKNIAAAGSPPEFAKAQWLMDGEQRVVVPGVW